jgi:TP901 family phage tail tape measure protein
MSFQVSYNYKLVDHVSPQLKKMGAAFTKIDKTAETSLTKTSSRFSNLNNKVIAPLGRQVLGLATAFGGLFATRNIIDKIANFGAEMSKIQAITGATNSQMQEMQDLARILGERTQFSASQAASGMAFLGQAGFTVNEILSSSESLLNLAAAGGLGLAEAMDIASNIMTPFNLKAEESGRVADVLASVAASANTNVLQLGGAFMNAAPLASQMGLTIEEAAAAIGVLGNAGIQGQIAGSKLDIVFRRLINPMGDSKKIAEQLGLSLQDLSPVGADLFTVLDKIGIKLDEIPSKQKKVEVATRLFGGEAAKAALVLLDQRKEMQNLTELGFGALGSAQRQAQVRMNNLRGDILEMNSAVESLVLSTGEKGLTGILRNATQSLTGFFRALAGNKEAFDNLNATVKLLIKLASIIGKIANVAFKNVIEPLSKGFLGFTDQISKGINRLGQVTGITDLIDFKKEIDKAKADREARFSGRFDVNVKAPEGTSTTLSVTENTEDLPVGINSIMAGAR